MPASPATFAVLSLSYDMPEHATHLWNIIHQQWEPNCPGMEFRLYHVYNGEDAWYPHSTGEDVLIRRKNQGHILGVIDMLNTGIAAILADGVEYAGIIVCSSDAWIADGTQVHQLLKALQSRDTDLITSAWAYPGLWAVEWFAVSPELAAVTFPLPTEFDSSQKTLSFLGDKVHKVAPVFQYSLVEEVLTQSLQRGISLLGKSLEECVRFLPSREFVGLHNRYWSPKLKYASHHSLSKKRSLLGLEV